MTDTLYPLFQRITHGVYVIGAAHGEQRNAFTAAWVMQVSFDPLLLALSVNPRHSSWGLIRESGAFSVNVLKRGQLELAGRFGKPASVDKLASVGWRPGNSGAPLLDDALAWFECRLEGYTNAGDHVLVVGRVVNGELRDAAAEPLTYRDTGELDGAAALYPASF
jgi:flavin reductase (DIM6/NTAB) family NADH-FMN oxidoreductase RutF